MSIKTGVIIGYSYKVYYGSTLLYEDEEEVFNTEEEAREEAESYIEMKIDDWKYDGAWSDWDDRDQFDVEIIYVIEDEEEDDRDE